jgi:hypothetical protein
MRNTETKQRRNAIGFVAGLVIAIMIGTFLRLYLLRDQILLDDEWHGMNYAALINSFWGVLTSFSLNLATSIPLNVYDYLLFKTIGWNETWLRLPSLIAGLASLIVFPILVRRVFNRRITFIFAALLAISPFLIFYSRMARPYSLVTLFGFSSIWAIYRWATKGGTKYAILYVALAALTICFHLFAAVGVIAPLGVVFATALRDRFRKAPRKTASPGLGAITIAAALVVAVAAVFAVAGLTSDAASEVVAQDQMTLATFAGLASLLSGTANPILIVAFLFLLAVGLVVIRKEKPVLGNIFLGAALCYFGALAFLKPASVHAAIVASRYVILLFPLSFLAVAAGIDAISKYIESHTAPATRFSLSRSLLNVAWIILVAGLFVSGPLPSLYTAPNNFTNHSAFQESYQRASWAQSYTSDIEKAFFSVRQEDIPSFYREIAKEKNISIIEYPMPFVNAFNLYYYYQHFHRKRIFMGYLPRIALPSDIYFIWVDDSLSVVADPKRFRFRNLIDMDDIEAIQSSGAKYIVLHNDLLGGEWKPHSDYPRQDQSVLIKSLKEKFNRAFGPPVFSDKNIVVFAVRLPEPKGIRSIYRRHSPQKIDRDTAQHDRDADSRSRRSEPGKIDNQ